MLIDVPYKHGDVVSIKLSSGEEMIGRLVEEKSDKVIIEKPRMITMMEQGLGLGPFMFSVGVDQKATISMNSVTCIAKTHVDFSKQYTEGTTGIKL